MNFYNIFYKILKMFRQILKFYYNPKILFATTCINSSLYYYYPHKNELEYCTESTHIFCINSNNINLLKIFFKVIPLSIIGGPITILKYMNLF